MVGVNIGGAHRLVRAFGPGMVERQRGDFVFVTSDVVAHPRPRMAAYVASKWGLEGLATALQMELEGTGVRAIVVRPGPTLTGMGMDWDPEEAPGEVLARSGPRLGDWPGTPLSSDPRAWPPAVVHAVAAPRGTHLERLVECVQPEAPLDQRGAP